MRNLAAPFLHLSSTAPPFSSSCNSITSYHLTIIQGNTRVPGWADSGKCGMSAEIFFLMRETATANQGFSLASVSALPYPCHLLPFGACGRPRQKRIGRLNRMGWGEAKRFLIPPPTLLSPAISWQVGQTPSFRFQGARGKEGVSTWANLSTSSGGGVGIRDELKGIDATFPYLFLVSELEPSPVIVHPMPPQ